MEKYSGMDRAAAMPHGWTHEDIDREEKQVEKAVRESGIRLGIEDVDVRYTGRGREYVVTIKPDFSKLKTKIKGKVMPAVLLWFDAEGELPISLRKRS